VRVIVAANGCRDGTVAEARARAAAFAARGWGFDVLDLPEGGKTRALNPAEAGLAPGIRVYVDADVRVSPPLLAALAGALSGSAPAPASGRARVPRARSAVSRLDARFWQRLPCVAEGGPRFGVCAANAAGRARWGAFPSIIADHRFARQHVVAAGGVQVAAAFDWPVTGR
jgi:hypothetical protein